MPNFPPNHQTPPPGRPPATQPHRASAPPARRGPDRQNYFDYALPQTVTLKVQCFFTDFDTSDKSTVVAENFDMGGAYIDKATLVFSKRKFTLATKNADRDLSWPAIKVNIKDPSEVGRLRALATPQVEAGWLTVIFCPFVDLPSDKDDKHLFGQTYDWAPGGGEEPDEQVFKPDGTRYASFVLINTRFLAPNRIILAHEMGHASGLSHHYGFTDNLMFETINPCEMSQMSCCQIASLATAYFASPKFALSDEFKKGCQACRQRFFDSVFATMADPVNRIDWNLHLELDPALRTRFLVDGCEQRFPNGL